MFRVGLPDAGCRPTLPHMCVSHMPCLRAQVTRWLSTCGNGIVEGDEECECGEVYEQGARGGGLWQGEGRGGEGAEGRYKCEMWGCGQGQ